MTATAEVTTTAVGQQRVSVTRRSFTTPEGQARFEQAYAATLAQWPVPFERFDVPTRFGPTHAIVAGPQDAPPLLLLHAFGFGASSWYANVGEWSRHYRVYAVDVIGDVTNSVLEQAISDRAQLAPWLSDVMDALGIASAPIVGHSYGGWTALNMALCAPERVQRIALLAPAASFVPLNGQFGLRTVLMAVFRKPWAIDSFLRWAVMKGNPIPERMAEQFTVGMQNFRWQQIVRPNVYTDSELRQIKAPVLLLFGDHEVIEDWRAAQERARRLLPNVQSETIPGAAHALIVEQPQAVNRRVLQFLGAGA